MDLYVLLTGLISGALYATTGVGISVVYRSSRLLNFALAGTSTLATYVATQLVTPDAPVALVVVIAVLAGAVAGGLSEVLLGPLRHYPPMTAGIATLGVLLIAQGIVVWVWGYEPRRVSWLSQSDLHLTVPGGTIDALQLVALGIAIVAIGLVYFFVEKTKYGLALRMSSSGPITAQLLGVNIWRTRRMSWVIGGAMGGVAALMVTALTYLDPASFTGFVIIAFIATVLGGFTNFIGVALGGVVVGVLVNVLRVEFSTELTQTYTLVLIAIVLALKPNGLLGKPEREVPEPNLPSVGKGSLLSRVINRRTRSSTASARAALDLSKEAGRPLVAKLAIGVGVALLLVALPYIVSPTLLPILPAAMTTFIAVLGLNMLVGYGGQFSVGHSAFMAVGAYSAALTTQHLNVSPLVGVALGTVAGLVVGLVVGLPVTRLDGVFLTIVTITLPLVTTELALLFEGFTGGATGLAYTFPDWLFTSENQYWFALAIAAVCAAMVHLLRHSVVGHRWIAVRDMLPGAQSIGIRVLTTRLTAFSLGCGLAGLAGGLDAGFVGSVGPSSYTMWLSIYLMAAVIIGGSGSIGGALLGSFFVVLLPHFVSGTSIPPDLLFGVVLLGVMMITPRGLVFVASRAFEALVTFVFRRASLDVARKDQETDLDVLRDHEDLPTEPMLFRERAALDRVHEHDRILEVSGLRAGYGQISVLRGVDLVVGRGEFTALIGANGAGKTTLLRAISGLIRIDEGNVNFEGSSIDGSRADEIARLGVAHVPEGRGVFPDLTVKENLLAGRFSAADREPDIDRALEVFPQLSRFLGRAAGTLSGGEQQMVAVARAIATKPKLLMLDEPSLGLSPKASKDLFATLELLKGSDLTVLLIEQNARAAMELADNCCLFSDGVIVREGSADSFGDDHMVETYLGVSS